VEPLGRLWLEAARAGFSPLLPAGHPLPGPDPERMRGGLVEPGVSLLVAVEDDRLAGFVGCGSNRDPDPEPGVGEVRSLFVGPAGWRRGTGSALIRAALADLAGRGYRQATLWSFEANDRANAFYEAHGFERDGATRTEEVWAHIEEVRYRRHLP
jgi:ribosomal protein S18 acetylase RimI-like enzyme